MNSPLVIVPTYNERENIDRLLDTILSLPSRWHVLVIDDRSPDGTADAVSTHAEYKNRVHLIQRPGKMGLGTAYCTGFRWALERAYEWIAQMDADFAHDPIDLEKLKGATENTPIALGSRYIQGGGTIGWAKHREFISRCANIYARIFTGVPAHDLTGGFKCFKRETLSKLEIDKVKSEGYAFQIEVTTQLYRKGCSVTEVPIIFKEREKGVSKFSKKIVFEAFFVVAKLG